MAGGIGSYREWVTILPRTEAAADATGQRVESWPDPPADTTQHAARFEAVTGGETATAQRQTYTTRAIRFRHAVTLAAVDRVKIDGETYTVTGVWSERSEIGRGLQTLATLVG
ncbi:MAG: phage head closure protein [Chloroflexota bacterium]